MNTTDLEVHYGSRERAMQQLTLSRQLWEYWQDKGIPRGRQAEIQILTRGKLRADLKAKRA